MKVSFVLYSFAAVTLVVQSSGTHQALADGSCLTLNNGGATTRQVCVTPSPSSAPANQTNNNQQQSQQNNNGHHVYPSSSNTKTTPNTGPDDLSLLVLAAAGVCGVFLRNKAKT